MNDNTTIIRPKREHGYFSVSNKPAQDKRLTWAARGVLFYLLSQPDDWKIIVKNLQQHCGRDKVYSILKELEENGYLERLNQQREKGRYGNATYILHEEPLTEKPYTVESNTVEPFTENAATYKILNKQKTKKEQNTKKTPRKRDAIFDQVAICLFNADLENLHRSEAGRIAKVSKAFKEKYPEITAQDIAEWCEYHKSNKGYDLPLDPAKVLKHYGDWLNGAAIDISHLEHTFDPECEHCYGSGTSVTDTYCHYCYAPQLQEVVKLVGGNVELAMRLLTDYKKQNLTG